MTATSSDCHFIKERKITNCSENLRHVEGFILDTPSTTLTLFSHRSLNPVSNCSLVKIAKGRHFIERTRTSAKSSCYHCDGFPVLYTVRSTLLEDLMDMHACVCSTRLVWCIELFTWGSCSIVFNRSGYWIEQVVSKIYDLPNWKFYLEMFLARILMFRNSLPARFAFTGAWIWNVLAWADHYETATIR